MPDIAYFDVRDHSNELSRTNLNMPIITSANFTAQAGLLTALVAAVDDISIGVMAGSGISHVANLGTIPPTEELAQIETAWKVIYTDSQPFLDPGTDLVPNPGYGKPFQLDIPCADYTDNLMLNSDRANIGDAGVVDAFVDAFEAVVKSPYGGSVTVIDIIVTGVDR